jgi:hypothetical protein
MRDRVWSIFAIGGVTIDVTIDGFVLTRANPETALPDFFPGIVPIGGGGLAVESFEDSAVTLTLRNSALTRNKVLNYGGGGAILIAQDNSSLDATFDGVSITGNTTTSGSGGGQGGLLAFIAPYAGVSPSVLGVHLSNCIIAGNTGDFSGGGFGGSDQSVDSSLTWDLLNTTVIRNRARAPNSFSTPHSDTGGGEESSSGSIPRPSSSTSRIPSCGATKSARPASERASSSLRWATAVLS